MSDAIRRRVTSHRLDDEQVQITLAGFMHQEFLHLHGMTIPAQTLRERFAEFSARTPNAKINDDAQQTALAQFLDDKFHPALGTNGIKLGLRRYVLATRIMLDEAIGIVEAGLRPRG